MRREMSRSQAFDPEGQKRAGGAASLPLPASHGPWPREKKTERHSAHHNRKTILNDSKSAVGESWGEVGGNEKGLKHRRSALKKQKD